MDTEKVTVMTYVTVLEVTALWTTAKKTFIFEKLQRTSNSAVAYKKHSRVGQF